MATNLAEATKHLQPIALAYQGRLNDNGLAAAIQGLNQKLTEELKRRDAENAELKQELNEIKTVLRELAEKRANQL